MELSADAQYAKSCAALTSELPVEVTAAVLEQMRQKHPRSQRPVDPGSPPAISAAAAPQLDAASVEREVRAFPRGPAPGPSGSRPQRLKKALQTAAHRDEVLQELLGLTNLLAKGHAPPPGVADLPGRRLAGGSAQEKRRPSIRGRWGDRAAPGGEVPLQPGL